MKETQKKKEKKSIEIVCPHCGSSKGYYSLNDFKNVPVHYNFDGSIKKVDFNKEFIDGRRKNAYCLDCNQLISTVRELQKKVRIQSNKHPVAVNRKRLHMTQEKLAEYLGCARETVAFWECKGVRIQKDEYIEKMNDLFKNPNFCNDLKKYYDEL